MIRTRKTKILLNALDNIIHVLHGRAPVGLTCAATLESEEAQEHGCEGCQYEWNYAVRTAKEALEKVGYPYPEREKEGKYP